MTDNTTKEKLRAVLLAAVMITSAVAMTAAFAGSAAAAEDTSSGDSGVDVTLDTNNDDLIAGSANQSLGTLTISDVANDSVGGNLTARTLVTLPKGVTVNQSQSDLIASTNQSGGLEVTDTTIENNGRTLRLDHGNSVGQANESIRIRGLVVDTSPSLSTSADSINVDTAVGAADFTVFENVEKPSASVADGSSVAVDSTDESFGNLDIDTGDNLNGQIGANTEIVIGLPDESGISFNSSETDMTSGTVPGPVDGESATVNDKRVTVPVTEDVGSGDNPQIQFTGISVDTTPSAQNANISVSVDAVESTGSIDLTADRGGNPAVQVNTLELYTGADTSAADSVSTSGAQQIFQNDPDGETGVDAAGSNIENITVNSPSSAVEIERADSDTLVEVSIPDSADISFDTSQQASVSASASNNIDSDGSITTNYADDKTLEVVVPAGSGGDDDNDQFEITNVAYNLSAGASGNTTLTATTNATQTVVDSSNVITVNQASVDEVKGDVDGDGVANPNDKEEKANLKIGETQTVTFALNNTTAAGTDYSVNKIGGGDLDLSVAHAPGDATPTLNTSSTVTTGEDGTVDVNVTLGDTIGTYSIVAASADDPTKNFTANLTAEAGPVAQFNATGKENALVDTSGLSSPPSKKVEQAVYKVQLEDANGNLNKSAGTDVPFSVSTSGDAEIRTVDYDIDAEGTPSGNDMHTANGAYEYQYGNDVASSAGVFYVWVSNPTAGDTDLTVTQSGTSDTGTATFYETVDSVDVSLNESSVAAGDTVEVSSTAQTSDGTTIEVANLSTGVVSNNTTVATPETQNIETGADGVATTTLTAENNGTTEIDATISGQTGTTTLTVGDSTGDSGTDQYVDENNVVTTTGLNAAVTDYLNDEVDPTTLNDLVTSYLTGDPVDTGN